MLTSKWGPVVVAIPVLLGLGAFWLYAHSASLRNVRFHSSKNLLATAYDEFLRTGDIPEVAGTGRLILWTNVVTIKGTNHVSALAFDPDRFSGAGLLAITTNREFLWFDEPDKAKLIGPRYKTPFFGGY